LSALLEVMMNPAETVWINLEESKHSKVEAYHAAMNIATEEMLQISLVDRKRPLTRAGAAFLLGRVADSNSEKSIQCLRNALNDPDPRVPVQALRSLTEFRVLSIQEVLPFFEVTSATVTYYATHAIGSVEGSQATEVLFFLANNIEASEAIRALSLRLIGERGSTEIAGALTQLLLDDSPAVRQHVALALGRMGAFSAVKSLYQTLIDPDEDVRYGVGVSLGLLGDVRSVPFLLKALQHADKYTQEMAELAFDRMGSESLSELLSAMRKMPLPYRVDAVERLDSLRDERVMLPFIQYLLDEQVYAPIRQALLNLGDPVDAPLIYVLEQDAVPALKEKAIRLLLDRECQEAIPVLMKLLKDDSVNLRELSARSLGKLKASEAEKALLGVIKKDSESDDVIAEALLSLGKLTKVSKKSKTVLQEHLDHLNSKVRGYSISALGEIGDVSMVEPLIERLMDKNQDNRPLMIQALASLGDNRAVEPLLNIVQEAKRNSIAGLKGAYLGSYAVQALAKLGEPKVIELLLTDWEEELEQGIQQMGSGAIPHLERALNNRDARIRQLAAEGLGLVGGSECLGILIDALQDTETGVVQAAATALQRIHTA
jgi:HEAT repeat protein